jgi:hypothetical protein
MSHQIVSTTAVAGTIRKSPSPIWFFIAPVVLVALALAIAPLALAPRTAETAAPDLAAYHQSEWASVPAPFSADGQAIYLAGERDRAAADLSAYFASEKAMAPVALDLSAYFASEKTLAPVAIPDLSTYVESEKTLAPVMVDLSAYFAGEREMAPVMGLGLTAEGLAAYRTSEWGRAPAARTMTAGEIGRAIYQASEWGRPVFQVAPANVDHPGR